MHEYEASLEDLFLAIMDNLGYAVKSSDDLLRSPVEARRVDAPESLGGGRRMSEASPLEPEAPVTGQARMDAAWGAHSGDETAADVAMASTAQSGQIF